MTNEELKACPDKLLAALERVIQKSKAYVAEKRVREDYLQNEQDCIDLRYAMLTRPQSAVDLEALKKPTPEDCDKNSADYHGGKQEGWNKCLNYLAAQGHIALAGGASTIPAAINEVLEGMGISKITVHKSNWLRGYDAGYEDALTKAKSRIAAKLKEMGVE